MTVAELIRKLQQADQGLEVVVAPAADMPFLGKLQDGKFEHEDAVVERLVSMDEHYEITGVAEIRDLQTEERVRRVVLVYEAGDILI